MWSHEDVCEVMQEWQSFQEVDDNNSIDADALSECELEFDCIASSALLKDDSFINSDAATDICSSSFVDQRSATHEERNTAVPAHPQISSKLSTDNSQAGPTLARGSLNLVFDEQYQTACSKLAESMNRSQLTRASLGMNNVRTSFSFSGSKNNGNFPVDSIDCTRKQLQAYLCAVNQRVFAGTSA